MTTAMRLSEVRPAADAALGMPRPAAAEYPHQEQAPAHVVRIVATGDNHLSAYLPRLSPQRRAERRRWLRAGFTAAVTYAIEHEAQLFLQLGDLFDTPTPGNEDRAFVAESLAQLRQAGITCATIGGNHDTPRAASDLGSESPHRVYEALDGLCYFPSHAELRPVLVTVAGLRVALAGLSNNPVAPPGSDPLLGAGVSDPFNTLGRADVGILLLHAGIEGMCRESEGERVVRLASLDALPPVFRVILAGHIHRFGRERRGVRGIVVPGATERMEFGSSAGSSGFSWLELDREGLRRVEHIPVAEQPRADVLIPTSRLWPGGFAARRPSPADGEPPEADVLLNAEDVALPAGVFASPVSASGRHWQGYAARDDEETPLRVIREALAEVCTPETMVRLRLRGPVTRERYHQLAFREVLLYGQQHAFSFELDTGELSLLDDWRVTRRDGGGGPISPTEEVRRLLEERRAGASERDPEWEASAEGAAELLLAYLRDAADREAGQ